MRLFCGICFPNAGYPANQWSERLESRPGRKKRENKNAGAAQSVTPTELFLMGAEAKRSFA